MLHRASTPLPALLCTATLLLGGCRSQCGVESSTVASGVVAGPARAPLAMVFMLLRAEVGPTQYYFSAGIDSPLAAAGGPLRGHVTRARLVTASGDLLAEFRTNTADLGGSSSSAAVTRDFSSRADFARVRDALNSTQSKLLVDTDLPGLEHLATVVRDVRQEQVAPGPCPGL